MLYTVTFQNLDCNEEVSRTCETLRKAQNWAKWLRNQAWTKDVAVYRGQAGEELIERQP